MGPMGPAGPRGIPGEDGLDAPEEAPEGIDIGDYQGFVGCTYIGSTVAGNTVFYESVLHFFSGGIRFIEANLETSEDGHERSGFSFGSVHSKSFIGLPVLSGIIKIEMSEDDERFRVYQDDVEVARFAWAGESCVDARLQ